MSVSMKDVAERAGVSTATVSHVINGTRFVADDTRKRVFQIMKELDYRPNSVARSLRSQKSKTIGLLVPLLASDTSNLFFMKVARGIQNSLKQYGYNLILGNSNENIEDEKEQIKVLNTQFIEGLIIAPTEGQHDYLKQVLGDYPVVFVDRKPIGYQGDCVLADDIGGAYQAVSLLIQKGHQRIGFISGDLGITTSDERHAGYRRALEDHGYTIDPSIIEIGEAVFENGYHFARKLVTEKQVTALFVADNILAMGAMGYLNQAGIEIPKQVAIIGFDEYDWTKITVPPLTVIKQPPYELGEKAAEILLKKIENSAINIQDYRLATELILRGSC